MIPVRRIDIGFRQVLLQEILRNRKIDRQLLEIDLRGETRNVASQVGAIGALRHAFCGRLRRSRLVQIDTGADQQRTLITRLAALRPMRVAKLDVLRGTPLTIYQQVDAVIARNEKALALKTAGIDGGTFGLKQHLRIEYHAPPRGLGSGSFSPCFSRHDNSRRRNKT